MNLTKSKSKTAGAANALAAILRAFARPIESGANAMGRVAAAADGGLPDHVNTLVAGKIWETINRLRFTVDNNEWKGFAEDMVGLERTLRELCELCEKERKIS
jgi:hypothetical protein